jgi:hypothetical protein
MADHAAIGRQRGPPYLMLSSTGRCCSLVARTFPGRSPYRLYSLSNIGSLLALISYPFLVEPLDSFQQSTWWTAGLRCSWFSAGMPPSISGTRPIEDAGDVATASLATDPKSRPAWYQPLL